MDIRKIMLWRLRCVLPDAMGEVASGGQLIGGYVILSRLTHCVRVGA